MKIDDHVRRETSDRIRQARALKFYDANAWIGRPSKDFPLARATSAEETATIMSKYYFSDALFSSWDGVELSPQDGNQSLIAFNQASHFHTIWTALPLFPDEQGPLPGKDRPHPSLRGVRVFPKSHHFIVTDWVLGSLCRWLLGHKIPLFVWHIEVELKDLYLLAVRYPELCIVLESQWQKIIYQNRVFYNLMRECSNVFLEISNVYTPDSIEYACREFGAERVIFGSFMPVSDPLVPMGMILDSVISIEEKALIAGGNLRRIISRLEP